ncbi:MAG: alpha/beta hydrolase [Anaerovoracaceae bacterium]
MKINLKGMDLFYEKEGSGKPLILVHGNGEDHTIFDEIIPELAKDFTIYALDSPGHGKSGKLEEYNYRKIAEYIVEFIQKLGMEDPYFYGFSDGGIIGLIIGAKYPQLLGKLVISGANLTPDGLKRAWRIIFNLGYIFTRSNKYKMVLEQPDISSKELEKIIVPTWIIAGSKDMIKESHTRYISEKIKDSKLDFLYGESHSSYVVHSKKLLPLLKERL